MTARHPATDHGLAVILGGGMANDGGRWREALHAVVLAVERRYDAFVADRRADEVPDDLRIVAYVGHGNADEVVVRGRVVDDPEPAEAIEGEGVLAAVRRMVARFETDELPGVPLRISLGSARVETVTDDEGYFDVRLRPGLDAAAGPWVEAEVALAAPFRGVEPPRRVAARVRLDPPDGDLVVVSDLDDTVLVTGAQRTWDMVRTTMTSSALTRTAFPGVAELYRALEAGTGGPPRPCCYVSSSPWNLHGFLTAFLAHRDVPLGPLLLRDLGVDEHKLVKASHGSHKLDRIDEVMELHPGRDVLLIGDSGQHDPQIYADVVDAHPDRVRAVWIREVRLDRLDGRVEAVAPRFEAAGVPLVVTDETTVLAEHAVELGLVTADTAARVRRAVERAADGRG